MTHPYGSGDYAASLAHLGAPFAVPEWGGHVLTRPTPHGARRDAMGPYPLTSLEPDADIAAGLERLRAAGLVSVVLVLDARLRPSLEALDSAFDFARPYKSHHLYDRGLGPLAYDKHHRYELKRALAQVRVAEVALADYRQAWGELYGELAARRGLGDLHTFPPAYHDALARLSGLCMFGAFVGQQLVSAHLFVTQDGYAISHLAASSAEGYAARAAYAVNDIAVAELSDCGLINFGGGAGLVDDPTDGLVRFKRGFCNAVAPSYLCGAVLDPDAYGALSAGHYESGFFPAYRGRRARELSDAH
jgi:hypothetical protein